MRGTIVLDRPIEWSILHNVKPTGPSMGFYADQEIPESIVDEFGGVLSTLASRRANSMACLMWTLSRPVNSSFGLASSTVA